MSKIIDKKFKLAVWIIILLSAISLRIIDFLGTDTNTSPMLIDKQIKVEDKFLDFSSYQKVILMIGEQRIIAWLADTPDKRRQGLSGVPSLNDDQGMLFVFQEKQRPIFWMKDMLFDLDFLWLNEGRIVDIDKNILASGGQLTLVQPDVEIDGVLEIKAGLIDRWGIKVGQEVRGY